MSRMIGQLWRGAVLSVLIPVGVALAGPSLAQATAITGFSSGLSSAPASIVAGPDGNLWFTESHAIGRITPSGAVNEYGTANGLNTGNMLFGDIALGSDGNLWFSDDGTTKAIGRVTPNGTINEFSGGNFDPINSFPNQITAGADGN